MAVQPLASQVGVAPACRALGVPRASFYRRQRPAPGHQQPRPTPARALCASERAHVLDVLASPRFVDRSPAEVVATLLDEGQYLCAERTMYRILAANQPVRERRNQRSHPCYTKPELVATGPNQTWSWDITRLRGPKRWTSFYLYVLLDIFSRCVVGWMVADRENAALAATLIEEDDEFFVFLLDAATGFSVGPAFEFLTQTTSSGTVGFDLSSLTALTLGLQFELGALPGDSGTGSRLTISNVRLVEASVDIAEPGTLALMMAGLLLLTLTARASRRTGEVG